MADQIVLAWTVDVGGSSLSPAEAATALAAVPLYVDPVTDPVLGQLFGLTVAAAGDSTATGATTATRTLTLNLNLANAPEAPPPFPCGPNTSSPPTLPYPLSDIVPLEGSFFVSTGLIAVPTSISMVGQLSPGNIIQFTAQPGVSYTVNSVSPTFISLTAPYTGATGDTPALRLAPAPVTLAAVYSSSSADTIAIPTTPAIPLGAGASEVEIDYFDSLGAGPFTVEVELTGRRPAPVVLDAGSIDIAVVSGFRVSSTGGFENSVGQITLVEVSSAIPDIPTDATHAEFKTLTDEAQTLIVKHLVYMPPSYSALAQQGAAHPQLSGDFIVTTGSTHVETTEDQSAVLSVGQIIQFASQLTEPQPVPTVDDLNIEDEWVNRSVLYTVAAVDPGFITLETPYTGIDENFTGQNNPNSNSETKGNLGDEVIRKLTGAFLIDPSPGAPPTDAQLSGPLGQFVQTSTVGPIMPPPTVLSDLFTQTIQLALAIPVTAEPITFLP